MLDISNHQGNANQSTVRHYLLQWLLSIKQKIKCWKGYGEKGTLAYHLWIVNWCSQEIKNRAVGSINSTSGYLSKANEITISKRYLSPPMFIVTIAKKWKQSKCLYQQMNV